MDNRLSRGWILFFLLLGILAGYGFCSLLRSAAGAEPDRFAAPGRLIQPPLRIYTIRGTCNKVTSGEQLTLHTDAGVVAVRLYGLSTPGKGKPYYDESRKVLSWLCVGHYVTLQYAGINLQGEYVGKAFVNEPKDSARIAKIVGKNLAIAHDHKQVDISATMLLNGLAKFDRQYEDSWMLKDEAFAEYEKRGIWQTDVRTRWDK